MKSLDKLVRDNIVQIITENGKKCTHHIADWIEYEEKLKDKLYEEVEEFFQDPCSEEMADIQEVLCALMEYYAISPYDMESDRILKKSFRGAFAKKIVLDTVEE